MLCREYPLIWTSYAIQQYVSILDFWAKHNNSTEYSQIIEQAVLKQEDIIRKNPEIGVVRKYRGLPLRCSIILRKYSLFYLIRNEEIIVVDFISNHLLSKEVEDFISLKDQSN